MDREPERLSDWPWVVVRVSCRLRPRRGRYRLARLAAKLGPECDLGTALDALAFDCPHRKAGVKPRQYAARCGARFTDLDGARPPARPAAPLAGPTLRLVRD